MTIHMRRHPEKPIFDIPVSCYYAFTVVRGQSGVKLVETRWPLSRDLVLIGMISAWARVVSNRAVADYSQDIAKYNADGLLFSRGAINCGGRVCCQLYPVMT